MVDYGFTKAQTMSWWGMKERYYSFNRNGYHFIVLDGNDENPKPWNEYYNRYIGPNQKMACRRFEKILFANHYI